MKSSVVLITFVAFAGSAASQSTSVSDADVIRPFPQIEFQPEAPDQPQSLAPLWGDRADGPAGTYLRTPGSWEAPLHSHTADYRAVVIQGTWSHWVPERGMSEGKPMSAGSFWTQKASEPHKDACLSQEECVVLLINDAPYRTQLSE